MELNNYSVSELVGLYSDILIELKSRGVLRTKNFVGELGEYLVLEYFNQSLKLPKLTMVPVGTKNINAIDSDGMRYSIKSTTGNVSGVIYGLQPYGSTETDIPLFEYIILCKLSENYELEGIYQLSWDLFLKHKKWHSRMAAWNIPVSQNVINDSIVIYEKKDESCISHKIDSSFNNRVPLTNKTPDVNVITEKQENAVIWEKKYGVDHVKVRANSIEIIKKILKCNLYKESQSRYVSSDRNTAVFVLSASYSNKNSEYWYSINDDNIPWMELFPQCYVSFALGSSEQLLMFTFDELREMMKHCLKTQDDAEKNKKAHFHFSFAIEQNKVLFKKKLPERELIDVTDKMIMGV